ncbi:MAG: hypothetical protein GWO24_38390, partial [Akkermansiaceae bacterium]|nr:hypothetical protein [Akkermansiaceae bacterium]
MSYFHICFAQVFRGAHGKVEGGRWELEFAGKRVVMPLTPGRISMDWDGALSILGCDFPIKETYRALVG